jgi:hypothetical protein
MCVQIYETRRDDEARRVEHVSVFRGGFAAIKKINDAAVFDQQISPGVYLLRRIDHVSVGDQ